MSDDGLKMPDSQIEEVKRNRDPGFGAKIKAHYRRFWWLHLIAFICSTLIIVLCIVYVGFPRIAQHGINKSTLEIQSQILSNPTPQSFHLEQTSVIGNHDRYHPRLDAFNASLSIDGSTLRPFAYLQFPAIHATETAASYVNQTVEIVNPDEWARYTTQVVNGDEIRVAIQGRTDLHEMRFPVTTVDYNKVTVLKALNHLNGFNVTEFEIKLQAEPDGTNMIGTVYIPNPSIMTITMGNVTFNNYVQGTYIGNSTLSNLVLAPGNNTVSMRSIINQTLVIEKIVSDYKDGLLPIDIVGNSSVYNGLHLPYFEQALAANTQHITLDVGAKLKAIGLTIPS